MVFGPTTGVVDVKVEAVRVNLAQVHQAGKGAYCSIKVHELVRRNDKVYKWMKA
jgi:putative protease